MKQTKKSGFTLVETLICIAVIALLALGTGTLLANGSGILRSSVFSSDSATLSGTLNAALTDLLRSSTLSGDSSAQAADGAAYVTAQDGASCVFTGSGLNFAAKNAHFSWAGDGILKVVSSDGGTNAVLNTGAYPELKIENFTCLWDGGSVLKVSYDIIGGTETKSVKDYVIRLLNVTSGEDPASAAEQVRLSATELGVYYPSAAGKNNWRSANYWNNDRTWDFILKKYPDWMDEVVRESSVLPLMPDSVIDAIVQRTIADYPSVFTQSNAGTLKSSIEAVIADEIYLVPYYMQGTAQYSAFVNGRDDYVRDVAVYFVTQTDADALRSGSGTHKATCMVYYGGHWYFHYGSYHIYRKIITPTTVFGNLSTTTSDEMLTMLQGTGWYRLS